MEKYLGYFAGICTTIAFVPQVIKVWRSKSTKDISLSMFAIFCTGVLCWLIYGFLIEDLPIMLANLITILLAGAILIGKIKYK